MANLIFLIAIGAGLLLAIVFSDTAKTRKQAILILGSLICVIVLSNIWHYTTVFIEDKIGSSINKSNVHTIKGKIITYLSHTPFEEDKASCPKINGVEVKDEAGKILGSTSVLIGEKQRVWVKPIVLNCFYSFQIDNIPETKSYQISNVGTLSIKEIRQKEWSVTAGAVDTRVTL